MMISPDIYIEQLKYKSYAELLPIKDELVDEIRYFEEHPNDDVIMHPSPEVIYQCNLNYLSNLCDLIAKKYNQEFIRGNSKS